MAFPHLADRTVLIVPPRNAVTRLQACLEVGWGAREFHKCAAALDTTCPLNFAYHVGLTN